MDARLMEWFAAQGWQPLEYQQQVWRAALAGESGLVHSSTGTGKTYAAWLPFVSQAANSGRAGVQALWITPLRALAEDTLLALRKPVGDLGLGWEIELRTGDTSSSDKQKQMKKPPRALVTTPETVSLLLSQKDSHAFFSGLRYVVVDEWHELLGSKRGVQVDLALARFRRWNPKLQVWGLSATLGDMTCAARALGTAQVIAGEQGKEIIVDSLIPERMDRFPWAGHLGIPMMPRVAEEMERCQSALVFTNTRAQAELWHQNLRLLLPELADQIGIHHGSIERAAREQAEDGLRTGRLRAVVCTSSLDLGVDFSPVERVFQVGSSKGVARLIQRAGRSGHQPGQPSRITLVPTNGLELIEIAALRDGVDQRRVENRQPPKLPLDVLAQHLVTIALGGGFLADELLEEVRASHAFRDLSDEDWKWCLDFVTQGGYALRAYPGYRRVTVSDDGRHRVEDRRVAMQHRMSIGTIVSDASVRVAYLKGGSIGTVEESFASKLKKGDTFIFAGKALSFAMLKDMTCYVRPSTSKKAGVVRWAGSRMSLSIELSHGLRSKLQEARDGEFTSEEMLASVEFLRLQDEWSHLPGLGETLIERIETREGHHLFCYPLEGRQVHEGLGALLGYRLAQRTPLTFTFSANDYGFELLSPDPIPADVDWKELLSPSHIATDLLKSLNAAELSRRQFREIARVAGLVFSGYPGAPKSAKQVQASSGLLFDVFSQYEPDSPLLGQATREVLDREIDQSRLADCLRRIEASTLIVTHPEKPTPFAFPLMVSRLRESLSSEEVDLRVKKMIESLGLQ